MRRMLGASLVLLGLVASLAVGCAKGAGEHGDHEGHPVDAPAAKQSQ